MTTALVFFDSLPADGALSAGQQELLAAARGLGEVVVVTGASGETAAQALGFAEVTGVYTGDGEISAPDPALVDLLETAVQESGAGVVLGSDVPETTDALARLAVRLDTGLVTGGIRVELSADQVAVAKPVLAGTYTTTAALSDAAVDRPLLVTLRPNSIDADQVAAALSPGAEPEVTGLPVSAGLGDRTAAEGQIEILERTELEKSERPALAEARVVVAGGRGVEGDFAPLEELADELGAALGASRAATDAGWIDHAAQVGQTGVTVSPQLYVSAGISGAVQQRSGMQTSQTIVAINKDEDAPVFEIADFGVVGDLFEVVPQMVQEIRRRKG